MVESGELDAVTISPTSAKLFMPAQLFDMLELTQVRLDQLEQSRLSGSHIEDRPNTPPAQDEEHEQVSRAALHNLLFPDMPVEVPSMPQPPPVHQAGQQPYAQQMYGQQHPQQFGGVQGWDPIMGGEVPRGFPSAPVIPLPTAPPVIQVQAPTASNTNYAASRSRGTHTPTPAGNDGIPLHEVAEEPSRESRSGLSARRDQSPERQDGVQDQEVLDSHNHSQHHRDEVNYPRPWDIATQRLYSWALVWPADEFTRALKKIALGYQVDDFALTIYTMMIFKRNLRHRMSSIPALPCDKLFVPPNMSDAINRAVHAKR